MHHTSDKETIETVDQVLTTVGVGSSDPYSYVELEGLLILILMNKLIFSKIEIFQLILKIGISRILGASADILQELSIFHLQKSNFVTLISPKNTILVGEILCNLGVITSL